MKFKEIGIKDPILKTLDNNNITTPTPIQEKSIPVVLAGKDILGCAQTGTGKTNAFALPLIQKLHENYVAEDKPVIKVLILTPTRELAMQIRNSVRTYLLGTKLKCSVIFGGVNQNSQKKVLKKGVDILVATPGRLLDLVNQKCAKLDNVKYLVLDEADTMLDMGFIHDVTKIRKCLPKERQTLLFSATMKDNIHDLAEDFLRNPEVIKVTPVSSTAEKIRQEVYFVDKVNKAKLLIDVLSHDVIKSVLVFTRTKHGANKLGEILEKEKIKSGVIHGNKSQNARVKALEDFKNGTTKILIATDIAARGIDIKDLSHVINYEIPESPETYVHRIGRTARAGKNGIAISLCDIDEKKDFKAIERLIKQEVDVNDSHNYPMTKFELSEKKKQGGRPNNRPKSSNKGRSPKTQDNNKFKRFEGNKNGKPRSSSNKNFRSNRRSK